METDKHYFIEGLFIIGFSIAAALFAVWLVGTGHRDDVLYRIHFYGVGQRARGRRSGEVPRRRCRHGQDHRPRSGRSAPGAGGRQLAQGGAGQDRYQGDPQDEGHHRRRPHRAEWRQPERAHPARVNGRTGKFRRFPRKRARSPRSSTCCRNFSTNSPPSRDQVKKVVTDVGATTTKIKENPSVLIWGPKETTTPTSKTTPGHR